MVKFIVDGRLPVQLGDFGSQDPRYPNITIVTSAAHSETEEDDGWLYVVVVDVAGIDEKLAKDVIAREIGVPVGEIEIEQQFVE